MTTPTIIFRTTDAGQWGVGKGSNLTPAEVDQNFYNVQQAIANIELTAGVGISSFTQVGTLLYVNLTDGTQQGPISIPLGVGAERLDQMVDVELESEVEDAAFLQYNQSNGIWISLSFNTLVSQISDAIGGGGGASALTELTDVDIPSTPNDGDFLRYSLSADAWVTESFGAFVAYFEALIAAADGGGGGATALSELTDVDIPSTPNDGDFLRYSLSADAWVPEDFEAFITYVSELPNYFAIANETDAFTISKTHANKYVIVTSNSDITATVASQSVAAWDADTEFVVEYRGTGSLQILGGSGVTINLPDGALAYARGDGAVLAFKRTANNAWTVTGDLAVENAGAQRLDDLSDVEIDSEIEDGSILRYSQSDGKWYPEDLPADVAPRSGSIVPAEGLLIQQTSVSTIHIYADAFTLFDSSGRAKRFTNVNRTLDITDSGVDGLDDSESESNSTWYYIFGIGKIDGSKASFLSSSLFPDLPNDYIYSGLLGAVRNDGSGDFIPFLQRGKEVAIEKTATPISGGTATTYTAVNLSAIVPPNAIMVSLWVAINSTSSGISTGYIAPEGSGTNATYGEWYKTHDNSYGANPDHFEMRFMLTTPQQCMYRGSGTDPSVSPFVNAFSFA